MLNKSTLELNFFHGEYENLDEWIVPTKPEWFSDLLKKTKSFKPTFSEPWNNNVTGCPSFVHIFKNSYTLKTITDMIIKPSDNFECGFECMFNNNLLTTESHPIQSQMSSLFDKNIKNLKLINHVKMKSNKRIHVMFLSPDMELSPFPLTAMTGFVNLPKGRFLDMNVNMWLNRKTFLHEIFVPKGTPYAYLFFPDGKPKLTTKIHESEENWHNLCPTRALAFNFSWMKANAKS